jgi:hypothetical protein
VNAVDRADVNTRRVLRADAGFANYVNSHYAVLLPKSSYRISGELNENADSIGTAIVPVHFSFATAKTLRREWGVGDKETRGQGDKEREIYYPLVPPSPCPLVFPLPIPQIEQSGNNIQQDRARIFGGVRLTFLLY